MILLSFLLCQPFRLCFINVWVHDMIPSVYKTEQFYY